MRLDEWLSAVVIVGDVVTSASRPSELFPNASANSEHGNTDVEDCIVDAFGMCVWPKTAS